MKQLKHGLLAVATVLGVSSTLFIASCEKDSCTTLKCKNGGTCADNFCRCPVGFEGAECEIKSADKFIGRWPGFIRCNVENFRDSLGPTFTDTLTIFMKEEPARLGVVRYRAPRDTFYGTASGETIVFEDYTDGSFKRSQAISLDAQSLSYLIVTTSDVNSPASQSNCRFVGYTLNKDKK